MLNFHKCACAKPNLHKIFTQLPNFFSIYQNTATCKVSFQFVIEKILKMRELSFPYMQMRYPTTQALMQLRLLPNTDTQNAIWKQSLIQVKVS